MTLKALEKKRLGIYKHWESIRDQVLSGHKVDRELIVEAMAQCNAIDEDIQKMSFRKYMKERDQAFLDCDKSCGDETADAQHEKLREQYQQIYGKDVKYG